MHGTRFFMGDPCRHNHSGQRYISTGECVECQRLRSNKPQSRARRLAYSRTLAGKAARDKSAAKPENMVRKSEYNNRPDVKARAAERRRKFYYDLTPTEYNFMFAGQQFRCAICLTDKPGGKGDWHTDHCHDTHEVRGILCHHCNTGIGKLGDNAAGVRRALAYLERFECKTNNSTPPTLQTAGQPKASQPIAPNAKPRTSYKAATSSLNIAGPSRRSA